jgi:PAS domain-containing protein
MFTDLKKTELSLLASEEKYLLLLNSIAEVTYGLDPKRTCTFCNRACARLLLGHQTPRTGLGGTCIRPRITRGRMESLPGARVRNLYGRLRRQGQSRQR